MASLSPPASLKDGVIAIRPWRQPDLPHLADLLEDPAIARWTGIPAPYTRREAMGVGTDSAIVDAADDDLLGGVGLKLHPAHSTAEVGYWVAAHARRRGIATRAVRLMARWAFGDLEVMRLELLTHVGNEASEGVARRCGFQREGLLRSARVMKGERVDLTLFSLLPDELVL